MRDYHLMNGAQLLAELHAWQSVLEEPTGPGKPSNGARRAATLEIEKIEAWLARVQLGFHGP